MIDYFDIKSYSSVSCKKETGIQTTACILYAVISIPHTEILKWQEDIQEKEEKLAQQKLKQKKYLHG